MIRLGIDVGDTELRVARVERRYRRTRLVASERIPRAAGDDLAAVVARLAARHRASSVALAAPLHLAAHRFLVLPFTEARRLREVVPLELAGQLPTDPGDVTTGFAVVARADGGTTVLAAAIRAADLAPYRAALGGHGTIALAPLPVWNLPGVAALEDAAVLVVDGERSSVSVRRGRRLVALRALASEPADPTAFAAEVRWTLAATGAAGPIVVAGAEASESVVSTLAGATGMRVVIVDDPACALAAGLAMGDGLILARSDEAATPRERRRLVGLAAAAAVLAVVDVGIVRLGLARREAMLARAVLETAAEALPPGTRLVAPRAQLEAAAGATAHGGVAPRAILSLLRDVSARIPAGVHVDLDELVVEGDLVRLHGRADGFESVDVVRRTLAATPGLRDVAAEDARAAVDGRGVEFGVRATWHPVAGAPS